MTEDQIAELLAGNVLVLTGAGISVASGLPTFRGNMGLYEGLNPYDMATLEAFKAHPVTVWNWYLMRIRDGMNAKPNAAHLALKELEDLAQKVTIVTTNVDPLHQMAGSKRVYQLHGDIFQTKCLNCGGVDELEMEFTRHDVTEETLPHCQCGGMLRPNVVWFGEYPWPDAFEAILDNLPPADVLLEVGTSGQVSYGFSQLAVGYEIPVVRINPDGAPEQGVTTINEPAEVALPRLVALSRPHARSR